MRRGKANHHLFLRGGVWWTRFERTDAFGHTRAVRTSTGCPKSEIARARTIRDERLGKSAVRREGIAVLPDPRPIGELIRLYLEEQSQPYDRTRNGALQPGTKKGAAGDRIIVERLRKAGLDFGLRADLLDTEAIFDLGVSLETMQKRGGGNLAGLTRRNTLRFLRCVYGWARRARNQRRTGVVSNPFDDLDKPDRARLFPKDVTAKAPPLAREQLRALYEKLPSHVYPPVRFAAHTGMRWHSEILRMMWGHVDFEQRVCITTPWAKRGKVRDVPLGDVALSILNSIRPENPGDDDPVWLNATGGPLRSVRRSYETAVQKVCPVPRPEWRYPDFHSLRRTCASALAQVAPTAVVGAILGHAKETVTDTYITVPVEAQIAALNGAAKLIDGGNVVAFPEQKVAANA
jgi:integrase